jgi:general secretion pathway protein D
MGPQVKIKSMQRVWIIVAVSLLASMPALPAFAANDASIDAPIISCGNGIPGGVYCAPTKKDLKEARNAYARGVKLQGQNRLEEAFTQFDQASRLEPQDLAFLTAEELTKSQLVFQRTERGDSLLALAQPEQAAAEFRAALKLDPDDAYVEERLTQALRGPAVSRLGELSATLASASEIELQPRKDLGTFHYRGDVRGLFSELASAYGVSAEFDDSVTAKPVRFYVDSVDFFTALRLACLVSGTMWTPLDAHQMMIAKDTKENHKQFDRMSLATFSVPGASTSQEVTELVTSLKTICEFQKISSGQNGTVEVRAPRSISRSTRSATISPAKSGCTFRILSISTTFRWQR